MLHTGYFIFSFICILPYTGTAAGQRALTRRKRGGHNSQELWYVICYAGNIVRSCSGNVNLLSGDIGKAEKYECPIQAAVDHISFDVCPGCCRILLVFRSETRTDVCADLSGYSLMNFSIAIKNADERQYSLLLRCFLYFYR